MAKRTAKRSGPAEHIAERLVRCRSRMLRKRIDAYLVLRAVDQAYLTGFDGEDGAVMVTARRVYVITDGRFDEHADRQAPWATKVLRKGPLAPAIARVARRLRLQRLHVQADAVDVAAHAALRRAAKPIRLTPAPAIVGEMRQIKDAVEIEAIRRAVDVAQRAFKRIVRHVRPGAVERDLAGRLEYEMRRAGADGAAFATIVAAGAHAALPHARAGDDVVRRDQIVLFDWGARVGGYCSDLTRVVAVGRIPARLRRIYEIVLQAQQAGIAAIAPGVTARQADAAARRIIAKAGYGKQFSHSLGHGLGLEVHEAPALSRRVERRLEPGMVVTVEPGVYVRGLGGVRIEDDVLVTRDGAEVLSDLDRSWAAATR